ncbi:IscS subfamily cysteine desulfurase [Kineobactrum sediminis]|uniref:cysteine desulfurase n=1 Tax=Kineobactrum sediminis TaxID=1905677 RepID=A0A2N5XYY1_9GAMM|nr:IscS subfamily cysteine desulfurase [Kineobactrum sediminis]PLW81342.1 IscS subfamily cysteine desulfurase [Kineobactrum sediminis]
MQNPVYLDYLATTPVDPRVAEAMAGCLTLDGNFGNPASRSHVYGWRAEQAVEQARRELADLLNADPREIVWTSGATEADNLAIKGVIGFYRERGGHIVTSRIEHKAVLDTCAWLEQQGCEVTWLSPGNDGLISADSVAAALRPDTVLVSIMQVNNELGTVNDIAAIGAVTRAAGVLLHVDAAQSVGKMAVDLAQLPVDLLSVSAHKFYGPKGIGALYVRRQPRVGLEAQIHGGGHERGMRSGTLPTHQIVGLGTAAAIAREELAGESIRLLAQRERLWHGIADIEGVSLNGHPQQRLPGALNVSVAGVEGESLLMSLRELALSSGSACTSESVEPSYVLRAIGLDSALAHSSLRLCCGRFTTEADIERAVTHLREVIMRLRGSV